MALPEKIVVLLGSLVNVPPFLYIPSEFSPTCTFPLYVILPVLAPKYAATVLFPDIMFVLTAPVTAASSRNIPTPACVPGASVVSPIVISVTIFET